MSGQEAEQKKKRKYPKILIREWKVVPGEWREATEQEIKELFGEDFTPWRSFSEMMERMRRFWRKIEAAFDEIWG